MNEFQTRARAIRDRLWNPANGRVSSELEIIPTSVWERGNDVVRSRLYGQQLVLIARQDRESERRRRTSAAAEKLLAFLQERKLVIAIAQQLCADEPPLPDVITVEEIKHVVCRHFGVSMIDLASKCRSLAITYPRQVVMYLARELTIRSYPEIALRLGGRDHTTVLHGHRKIKAAIPLNPRVSADVDAVKSMLGVYE